MVGKPGGLVGWGEIHKRGGDTAPRPLPPAHPPPPAPLEPQWAEISLLISNSAPQLPGLDCRGLWNYCVPSHSVGAAP